MFIERIKDKFSSSDPIFTSDILNLYPNFSRAYVFRLLKKSENKGEIVKFSNGVYYLPKKTFFGISTINPDIIIKRKYLRWNNNVYGIYSGLKLLNMFSITTQVPNVIEVVTNNETTNRREIIMEGRKFVLRKSRIQINKTNVNAYMVLQLFSDLVSINELDVYSKQKIVNFIKENKITQKQLLDLAINFPAKTLKNLIGSGILYDVA